MPKKDRKDDCENEACEGAGCPANVPLSHRRGKEKLAIGSCVTFGRYPQNNGDTPEPIVWQVLDIEDNEALLLSRCGLDCQPFHHEESEVCWKTCDLRKWLNDDFLHKAFDSEEISMISDKVIFTEDNALYKSKGGGNTKDRLFCLTIEEALIYFEQTITMFGCKEKWHSYAFGRDLWVSRSRSCPVTEYAVAQGAWKAVCCEKYRSKSNEWWFENCCFWLRSSGDGNDKAAYADNIGQVRFSGREVNYDIYAVRPALRLKI